MAVYWDESLMQDEHRSPDVLAEGDSWFSYWIPGDGNLINRFDRDIWKDQYVILCIATPGDEAIRMVDGNSRWVLQETLKSYSTIKMLLFSGGGNDIAARHLLGLLQPRCSAAPGTTARASGKASLPGDWRRSSTPTAISSRSGTCAVPRP